MKANHWQNSQVKKIILLHIASTCKQRNRLCSPHNTSACEHQKTEKSLCATSLTYYFPFFYLAVGQRCGPFVENTLLFMHILKYSYFLARYLFIHILISYSIFGHINKLIGFLIWQALLHLQSLLRATLACCIHAVEQPVTAQRRTRGVTGSGKPKNLFEFAKSLYSKSLGCANISFRCLWVLPVIYLQSF